MIDLNKSRQGAMLKFSTNKQSQLPRQPLSSLPVNALFMLRTNRPGSGAVYTKFMVMADGSALAVERSTSRGERGKFGDPYKFILNIADEVTRNPDLDGDYGVFVCDEAFGN
jgi:hypothetical protein